jgi:hypothetical protein
MSWEYRYKTDKQLKDWFDDKVRKGINGFVDFTDFREWYFENIRDRQCYYCGLTERESQQIIHDGLLTSKRFPFGGMFSQGVNRGYWLEVDKKNPIGQYSRENCVPSCYFCNNDKSDVFTDEQYREFVTDRIGFIRRLLNNNE